MVISAMKLCVFLLYVSWNFKLSFCLFVFYLHPPCFLQREVRKLPEMQFNSLLSFWGLTTHTYLNSSILFPCMYFYSFPLSFFLLLSILPSFYCLTPKLLFLNISFSMSLIYSILLILALPNANIKEPWAIPIIRFF